MEKDKKQIGSRGPKPVWMLGLAVGVCFLIAGVVNDQFADIYRKAIMICLECIGIG